MAKDIDITPNQAKHLIERMLADKTITRRDLQRHMKEMNDEISELESRLANLRVAVGSTAPKRARTKKSGKGQSGKKAARKRKPLSPEAKASMAVQGRYISYVRRFKGKQKERYQQMAREQGREKAIEAMQKELG